MASPKWGTYWRDVCAPKLKAAKKLSGKVDADIMAAVNEAVPRSAKRQQVNHWFTGRREPTVQQFLAVCDEVNADPRHILFEDAPAERKPLLDIAAPRRRIPSKTKRTRKML